MLNTEHASFKSLDDNLTQAIINFNLLNLNNRPFIDSIRLQTTYSKWLDQNVDIQTTDIDNQSRATLEMAEIIDNMLVVTLHGANLTSIDSTHILKMTLTALEFFHLHPDNVSIELNRCELNEATLYSLWEHTK